MTSIMPEGEALRKAVKYIASELQENPAAVPGQLIEQAILRFDLSPKDAEFLSEFYRKKKTGSDAVS